MASRLSQYLPGFRLVTGDSLNRFVDALNNLAGFGTADTVAMTAEIYAYSLLTVDGAIAPATPATYVITKAGVYAGTLAAPAVADNGKVIRVTSATANAHTITATGLLQPGTAAVNLATFAAQP